MLRSVMYGADKIPDSWFDKVPGGFYKTKDGKTHAVKDKDKDKDKSKRDSDNASRRSTSDSRKSGGDRSRRYSTGEALRDQKDGRQDDGSRSRLQTRPRDRDRDRPQRSSYDGMEDDDEDGAYYSGDDRHRRRKHGSTRQPRRRSFEDDRGYPQMMSGGLGSPPPRDERRMNDQFGQAPPVAPMAPMMGAAAMTGARIGLESEARRAYDGPISPPPPQTSQPAGNGKPSIASGYVPYAHIYGAPAQQTREPRRVTPPQSSNDGYERPTGHRAGRHHQNPDTQYSSAGARDSGYGSGRSYDHRGDDRYMGYDERGRPYPMSPPNDYSPTSDNRDSRQSTREREPEDRVRRSKSQGGNRNRYVPPEYADTVSPTSATSPMMPVDPRKPLNAQMGGSGGGGSGR